METYTVEYESLYTKNFKCSLDDLINKLADKTYKENSAVSIYDSNHKRLGNIISGFWYPAK